MECRSLLLAMQDPTPWVSLAILRNATHPKITSPLSLLSTNSPAGDTDSDSDEKLSKDVKKEQKKLFNAKTGKAGKDQAGVRVVVFNAGVEKDGCTIETPHGKHVMRHT